MISVKEIVYECTSDPDCNNRLVIKVDRMIKLAGSVEIGAERVCLKCGYVMTRRITTGEGE